MHNPELHALAAVPWQYFCTFSFRSEKHCARFGPQMFVALVRIQARSFGVHFSRNPLVPAAGAWRVHGPVASTCGNRGAAPFAGARNCLALMSQWERLGGGIARVSVYNSSLDGLDYILKGSGLTESTAKRWAGDYHELSKFGGSCDVTLSESVCRYLSNRSRSGWRGMGGHETRGTDTASSTVQSGVSKAPPFESVTGPAITVQTPLNS